MVSLADLTRVYEACRGPWQLTAPKMPWECARPPPPAQPVPELPCVGLRQKTKRWARVTTKIRAEKQLGWCLFPVSPPTLLAPVGGHSMPHTWGFGRAFQGAWEWVSVLAPHWRPKQVQKLPQDRHHSGVSLSPPPPPEESRDKAPLSEVEPEGLRRLSLRGLSFVPRARLQPRRRQVPHARGQAGSHPEDSRLKKGGGGHRAGPAAQVGKGRHPGAKPQRGLTHDLGRELTGVLDSGG